MYKLSSIFDSEINGIWVAIYFHFPIYNIIYRNENNKGMQKVIYVDMKTILLHSVTTKALFDVKNLTPIIVNNTISLLNVRIIFIL